MMRCLFYLALIGSLLKLPGGLYAQDCPVLRAAAQQIEQEKAEALKINRDLMRELGQRRQKARAAHLAIPDDVLRRLETLDPNHPIYHDERGQCPAGSTAWGTIKDLREYKRDSLEFENGQILSRIELLQNFMDGQSYAASTSVRSEATPVARALQSNRTIFADKTYVLCRFDPRTVDLRITPFGKVDGFGFAEMQRRLQARNQTLLLAMNAGMYHPDKQPVGLLVLNGEERTPLNQRQGSGNFYLPPNGVFGVTRQGAAFILPTPDFARRYPDASGLSLATQSGPMMLVDGQINRQFTQGSSNLHFRNAVGITREGEVIFALSEQRVNFYEFSQFLLQQGCTDALYLDGVVSRMYLPAINRTQDLHDSQHLGPILYIVD